MDSVGRLLLAFPANPITDFMAGALWLVRRTLFPVGAGVGAVTTGGINADYREGLWPGDVPFPTVYYDGDNWRPNAQKWDWNKLLTNFTRAETTTDGVITRIANNSGSPVSLKVFGKDSGNVQVTLPAGRVLWMAGQDIGDDDLVVRFDGSPDGGGGWGRLIFNDPRLFFTPTAKIAYFQHSKEEDYSEGQERSFQLPADNGRSQLDITIKRLYDPKDWMSVEERAQLDAINLYGVLGPSNLADWAVFSISIDFLGDRR